MLSTAELQEILKGISYKPGWSFRIYDGKHEGQHIVIKTEVVDAYDLDKTVTLDVHSMLPPMETERQFLTWLLWRLKRIEVHEAREYFRVNDKIFDDPHKEGADKDL